MRIFTASFGTETNTFAPIPTNKESFLSTCYFPAGTHPEGATLLSFVIPELRKVAATAPDITVVEGLTTFCNPSNKINQDVYEEFRDTILAEVEAALPLQAVVMGLHGGVTELSGAATPPCHTSMPVSEPPPCSSALLSFSLDHRAPAPLSAGLSDSGPVPYTCAAASVAHGYDDVEGDLLARIRQLIGPSAVLSAHLDPHSHLTAQRVAACDIIIAYKEFPHVDQAERAEETVALTVRAARGEIKPVMEVFDCKM
eukprot:SAG22_NODE_2860_length_2150_cov_2.048269_1_plen_256_part_00